jgi:hypothetical protein
VKTDDLIALLSTNVEPVARRQVGRIVGGAIAAAAVAALAVMVFAFGVRADLTRAGVLTGVALKLAFTLAIVVVASVYLLRLARPGGERRTPIAVVIVPFAAIALLAAINLALAPMSHWDDMIAGRDWLECLLSIPIIAVVPFAIVIWAVRGMAPTDLVRTGALAGLVAGSLSAAGYALHCVDDSPPFVALWYGGTIALCTLAGAKLGPRLLRW